MTQLEEYKEQRELLLARIQECRRIAYDADTSREEKRASRRKWNHYQTLLNELEIQLQAFDPEYSAIKHGQRAHTTVFSMNTINRETGKEIGDRIGIHTDLDGEVIPYDAEDSGQSAAVDERLQEQRRALLFVAQNIPPRQAEVLDLKYNRGYSLLKIAEVMGINKQSAWDELNRARQIMRSWVELTSAVRDCTFSETVFAFDEFLDRIPDAFPLKCRDILLTLYDAPASAYQSRLELANATHEKISTITNHLRMLKTLCDVYGIPAAATHPLIASSKPRECSLPHVLRRQGFGTDYTYGANVRHDDPALNFQQRRPMFRYRSLEEAIHGYLGDMYGVPKIGESAIFVAEGLRLFDEPRIRIARERIDEGKTLRDCAARKDSCVIQVTTDVIKTAALYAFFRYDVARIVETGDLRALLESWRFVPERSDEALLALWEHPEMTCASRLMEMIGTSSVSNTGKLLRRIGEMSSWWGIPAEWLPPLVLRYKPEGMSRSPTANDFKRAVALRRDTQTGGGCDAGA